MSVPTVQQIDLERFAQLETEERVVQRLIDASMGFPACSVSCVRTPAGGGSPEGRHVHRVDQIFVVMSGTMSLEVDGERSEAGPGSLVVFPAGVPHRSWNSGREPTIHLTISVPSPDPSVPFATRVD